eukprot:970854-Rhodomonas_salina.3
MVFSNPPPFPYPFCSLVLLPVSLLLLPCPHGGAFVSAGLGRQSADSGSDSGSRHFYPTSFCTI